MNIFLGEPLNISNGTVEQKVINNEPVKIIKGEKFTYYVKTQNGLVTEVLARAKRELAPISYFIQNPDQCTKKLLFRAPLRMAVWEYDCPQGKVEYKTFGPPGFLNTKVKLLK